MSTERNLKAGTKWSITEVLESYNESMSRLIKKKITQNFRYYLLPKEFRNGLKYCINTRGKGIRSTLSLISCQAVGGTASKAMHAGASVELIHNAMLVYDDIIDKDEVRRGVISVHKKYSKELGILLGGYLVSRALSLIGGSLEISQALYSTLNESVLGEVMELYAKIDDEEKYLLMVKRKTASLFKTAALIGGIMGDASSQQCNILSKYGENLGIAFQIRDDILGSVGNKETIGKNVGTDFLRGSPTIISVNLAKALHISIDDLRQISINKGLESITQLPEFQVALEKAKRHCQSYGEKSEGALASMPQSIYKEYLLELAVFVVNRVS